jgi:hypothetical protein
MNSDEYIAAVDQLPHRWQIFIDSACDSIGRGHMCKHSGISVLFLSGILL